MISCNHDPNMKAIIQESTMNWTRLTADDISNPYNCDVWTLSGYYVMYSATTNPWALIDNGPRQSVHIACYARLETAMDAGDNLAAIDAIVLH